MLHTAFPFPCLQVRLGNSKFDKEFVERRRCVLCVFVFPSLCCSVVNDDVLSLPHWGGSLQLLHEMGKLIVSPPLLWCRPTSKHSLTPAAFVLVIPIHLQDCIGSLLARGANSR